MSHSITGPRGTSFIYNGDGSGDVELVSGEKRLSVPVEDLLSFVGELVRSQRIRELEDASAEELLGLAAKPPSKAGLFVPAGDGTSRCAGCGFRVRGEPTTMRIKLPDA